MRTAFVNALVSAAEKDERVWLVVGDLGFGVVEEFARRFPERFVNVGVAEQNMTGVASGIALSDKVVFTYSIGNFPTLRCLEQIRNDVCYHNANVKIVAVGGGFAYGSLGMTHHATEDLAIMRALPNMTVIAPGDPIEAEAATRAVIASAGACYLRLGRAGEPIVHSQAIDFRIGRAISLRSGKDLTLIATGSMVPCALSVAQRLEDHDISVSVLSMHTLKPLDVEAIETAARDTKAIATLEEHSKLGGLGGAVAEVLAEISNRSVSFIRIGVDSTFVSRAGSQQYLRKQVGLTTEDITARLLKFLSVRPSDSDSLVDSSSRNR